MTKKYAGALAKLNYLILVIFFFFFNYTYLLFLQQSLSVFCLIEACLFSTLSILIFKIIQSVHGHNYESKIPSLFRGLVSRWLTLFFKIAAPVSKIGSEVNELEYFFILNLFQKSFISQCEMWQLYN